MIAKICLEGIFVFLFCVFLSCDICIPFVIPIHNSQKSGSAGAVCGSQKSLSAGAVDRVVVFVGGARTFLEHQAVDEILGCRGRVHGDRRRGGTRRLEIGRAHV